MNYKTLFLKIGLSIGIFLFLSNNLFAQDDLLDMLGSDDDIHYTFATFKSTRIVNGHTVDIEKKGELQFLIQHRFNQFSNGSTKLWGLDGATMRLGFEYGLADAWAIGFGRSPTNSTYDFYSKLKLLRQSSGGKNMPISAVWVATTTYRQADIATTTDLNSNHRFIYINQLLLARKFGKSISLQLMPTYYHRNLVLDEQGEKNSFFTMGFAGRVKLTNRMTIVGEYFSVDDNVKENPYALGLEIETGGHVFQLHVTNAKGMADGQYFTQTFDQEWRFGFNISRVFQLKKHKDSE